MKKVGFIDYYLDEWHANNYPEKIHNASNGRFEVSYAYGMIDSPKGGLTNKEWAEKYNVQLLKTIEEVVEKSDVLIVLSPDNPEMHEELADLPLKSGKLVYIDKTFAPDRETAIRIFEKADKHGTKCFSSSALRYASELKDVARLKISRIYSEGFGNFDIYAIHQLEMIVMLMECRPFRVMGLGDMIHPSIIIEFEDGRFAQMYQCMEKKYRLTLADEKNVETECHIQSSYFDLFIEALVEFFDTGILPLAHEQTIDVIAIRAAGIKALETPFTWVEV